MSIPRNHVACTCTKCIQSTYLDSTGQSFPGKLVARNTRINHRRKDNSNLGNNEVGGKRCASSTSTRTIFTEAPSLIVPIRIAVCLLATWLHLACGVSRATTAIVLKFLDIIVNAAVKAQPTTIPLSNASHTPISIPHDVHTTISSLFLEPHIKRYACCPRCFCQYNAAELPRTCFWKETQRSKACGEKLWITRTTRRGPRDIPRQLYNVQSFESWLQFLLSRPGVEDLLDLSYNHEPPPTGLMHDIWDSPAWRSLGPFTSTQGNLTFSFYIDWFNPFTNKIAGKIASCGAIIMFCLNLPYHCRHRPEYTFFAGITPPPHEPTVTTISSLLDPIVGELQELYVGKVIRSYRYPDGRLTKVAILPVIADLLAVRKALGYTSVTSHHFCSFCTLQYSEVERLDSTSWEPRIGPRVRAAAQEWRQASTQKARKLLLEKNGIRWTPLHELFYRDPVQHTVLGVMHNWLEGILQHHTRLKWGIGIPERSLRHAAQRGTKNAEDTESDDGGDTDVEMLDAELADLQTDSQHFNDTPQAVHRTQSSGIFVPGPGSEGGESEDSEYRSEFDIAEGDIECLFDAEALSRICSCIASAVIPSWIDRPPANLGEKSHGKLKADNWLTLFTIFFPLIIPEVWHTSKAPRHKKLLANFHDLVACTHIVVSHSASSAMASMFSNAYHQYRQSSQQLFPHIPSRPNHHYAMHIPELLIFWGPLIKLSEFPYERHNGLLQNIKTNKHMLQKLKWSTYLPLKPVFPLQFMIYFLRLFNRSNQIIKTIDTYPILLIP
ncbi:hypothetical protein AGABI1DRAFT_102734 [Agaricus bisporus var. burnettii JB137-S8]|uniref:Transposase domain-containing protein n=1 Tax=Agaricus bisporus var. burnettii (strain JB137-S8 / ATCC MYA-4627 / FGSC 10392) TaxID=597362 RepID=K5VMR0_AGABU|nr:uncharacterized protein AGABI1DRAFT_102734 [Agaricus bisporus var. burnettii JB137-S8]EKM75724.1 hypothetical protein AGABI1DRAFT_102734 [Agaricus bisporus var. burnettii JB137-S8]